MRKQKHPFYLLTVCGFQIFLIVMGIALLIRNQISNHVTMNSWLVLSIVLISILGITQTIPSIRKYYKNSDNN